VRRDEFLTPARAQTLLVPRMQRVQRRREDDGVRLVARPRPRIDGDESREDAVGLLLGPGGAVRRRLSRREDVNRGSSERPLASAAIEEKFLENAQRVIPKARAEAVRDAILNIDTSADVRTVTRELCLR